MPNFTKNGKIKQMPFKKGVAFEKLPEKHKKKKTITDEIYKLLSEVDETTGQTRIRELAETLLGLALSGDLQAIRTVIGYVDGLPAPVSRIDDRVEVVVLGLPEGKPKEAEKEESESEAVEIEVSP